MGETRANEFRALRLDKATIELAAAVAIRSKKETP